jgi:phosphatidylglycerophosphate synthase
MSSSDIKKHGQLIKHFYRVCGHFIALKLRHTSISANQITLSRMIIMIIIALFIISEIYLLHLVAAFLILIFSMFDALDGSLANLKNERSTLGAWLDPQVDRLGFLILFIVVAYFLSKTNFLYVYLSMYTINIFYFRGAISGDIYHKDKFKLLRDSNNKDLTNNELFKNKRGLMSFIKSAHFQLSPHTHNVALYIALGLAFQIVGFVMIYLAIYLTIWYFWDGFKVIKKANQIDYIKEK